MDVMPNLRSALLDLLYCRPDLQLEKFCRALQDLFSTRIQSETR